MADESPWCRVSTWMLVAVVATTGYVGWQVIPLSRRMDAIDRDRLEMNDRLQREIEKLRDDFERARMLAASQTGAIGPRPAEREPAAIRSPVTTPTPSAREAGSATAPAPAAGIRVSPTNAETYFSRRLLPEDAAIATFLVESIPVPEIARRLRHSTTYIIAKGIQIEKQLSAAPDVPPDVQAALHAAIERAKAQR